ncbi:MAG TPA: 50S ribosomal protein L29 [Candidatus Dormibacteraeota bacterium]|jgi:large subunit ribosomal protein L29|nr:50S ribosomal protein L29 [Candidatus Dormibacteraeota bacterium]
MTKQTDTLNELRRMTMVELDDHLSKQRRRLFEVRFQQATGQVENHRQVREIRHEIARAMTVKIEIERGLRPELVEEAVARPAASKSKPARAPRAAKPAPRLEVPAVVPAAVPVAESSEPAHEPTREDAETVDAQEDVDE